KPRGDAVDDLDIDAERAQMLRFFTAATEYEGVAALEPHDALALQRLGGHQLFDEGLRRARAAAALADVDDARRFARVAQHAIADQVVDQQHAGRANRADRLDRQQLGVARAGADEVNDGLALTHALISDSAVLLHAANARRMHSDCCTSGVGAGFSPLTTDWM